VVVREVQTLTLAPLSLDSIRVLGSLHNLNLPYADYHLTLSIRRLLGSEVTESEVQLPLTRAFEKDRRLLLLERIRTF
jgi:hypothetical protein